jgi:hypothetical protein
MAMKSSILLFAALFTALSCGSENDGGGSGGGGGDGKCAGALEYHAGIQKAGLEGHYTIAILQASPAPPHIGDNTWTVRVTDASGAPVDGATLILGTWMPAHEHPGGRGTTVTPKGDGTYELAPVNFNMDELWETTITVEASETDSVMFPFCIAG